MGFTPYHSPVPISLHRAYEFVRKLRLPPGYVIYVNRVQGNQRDVIGSKGNGETLPPLEECGDLEITLWYGNTLQGMIVPKTTQRIYPAEVFYDTERAVEILDRIINDQNPLFRRR